MAGQQENNRAALRFSGPRKARGRADYMRRRDLQDSHREPVLGARMLSARLEARETQAQFCRHFEISRGTYGKWEEFAPPPGLRALFVRLVLARLADRAKWRRYKRRKAATKKLEPKFQPRAKVAPAHARGDNGAQ